MKVILVNMKLRGLHVLRLKDLASCPFFLMSPVAVAVQKIILFFVTATGLMSHVAC